MGQFINDYADMLKYILPNGKERRRTVRRRMRDNRAPITNTGCGGCGKK